MAASPGPLPARAFLEIFLSGSGVPIQRALLLYIVLVFNLGSQGVATNVKKGVMWVM